MAKKGLTLVGSKKPRMRANTQRDWTKAKEESFLTILGETCNVTRAAEEAGVSLGGVYKRRKSNAAFRAAWAEAIATAYRRLELVLLERAFNGTEKVTTRRDGSEERVREYSTSAGLALLRMHRDAVVEAETEYQPEHVDEIRQRLVDKLARLKKRHAAEAEQE